MQDHLPIVLIELVLVFGGTLAFGWWQLRSIRRDREALAARRRAEADAERRAAGVGPPAAGGDAADRPLADGAHDQRARQ